MQIFIKDEDAGLWLVDTAKLSLSPDLELALAFPNVVAAQEAHASFRARLPDVRMAMFAADRALSTDMRDVEPMGDLEELIEVPRVPLNGALELYAELKKSSKYFHQFPGAQKVTAIIPPSYGDHYCFRVAHNAYRHEDLIFSVKVRGEFMRLDKFVVPKTERQVAA